MINVGYENDKRLELVSFWRAVHLNNFNAVQSALANRCGWCSHMLPEKTWDRVPLIHKLQNKHFALGLGIIPLWRHRSRSMYQLCSEK